MRCVPKFERKKSFDKNRGSTSYTIFFLCFYLRQPLKTTNNSIKKLYNPMLQIQKAYADQTAQPTQLLAAVQERSPRCFPQLTAVSFWGEMRPDPRDRRREVERRSSLHDLRINDRLRNLETSQQKAFCRVYKLETP